MARGERELAPGRPGPGGARPGPAPAAGPCRCCECGRDLGECAFCEGPACPEAICSRDLALALGERTGVLHAHGG